MSFLSLLPAVGAALIWVPTAIYLALAGFWVKAIVLVAVGALVIGLVDNLLRPSLVGRETKLPDYVVLISTIGGISLLGVNGFVIGPLIAALFIAAWGYSWRRRARRIPDDAAGAFIDGFRNFRPPDWFDRFEPSSWGVAAMSAWGVAVFDKRCKPQICGTTI